MNSYIEIKIDHINSELSEIIIAELSAIGFSGFEENDDKLTAFIEAADYSAQETNAVLSHYRLQFSIEELQPKNWNEEWEKNFEPVIVNDFVAVRADFHKPIHNVQHEIIITPKMSFGTGHHATTFLMIQQMQKLDFKNKSVFDFGTGTGILAILAEKLGAQKILAIDNDEWSIENAKENVSKNNSSAVEIVLQNEPGRSKKFDIVLANINKNVILEFLPALKECMNPHSHLLVSGLLTTDEREIINRAKDLHINHLDTFTLNNWLCLHFEN